MDLLMILAFLIGLFLLLLVIDKVTNKILGIKKIKLSETPGKRLERWVNVICLIILVYMISSATENSGTLIIFYWMIYMAFLYGFQAIMEFIYIKVSKQYISSMILLITVLVIMFNVDYFPFAD